MSRFGATVLIRCLSTSFGNAQSSLCDGTPNLRLLPLLVNDMNQSRVLGRPHGNPPNPQTPQTPPIAVDESRLNYKVGQSVRLYNNSSITLPRGGGGWTSWREEGQRRRGRGGDEGVAAEDDGERLSQSTLTPPSLASVAITWIHSPLCGVESGRLSFFAVDNHDVSAGFLSDGHGQLLALLSRLTAHCTRSDVSTSPLVARRRVKQQYRHDQEHHFSLPVTCERYST